MVLTPAPNVILLCIKQGDGAMKRFLVAIAVTMMLSACGKDDIGYDSGYDDGFSATFNTKCKIRNTLIYGAWDNVEYKRGYADGSDEAVRYIATEGCEL